MIAFSPANPYQAGDQGRNKPYPAEAGIHTKTGTVIDASVR